MPRCARKTDLDVYRIRKEGGAGIENAIVLCQACHERRITSTRFLDRLSQLEPAVRERALEKSSNQCECTSIQNCH